MKNTPRGCGGHGKRPPQNNLLGGGWVSAPQGHEEPGVYPTFVDLIYITFS